jgi:hypothetical protein
MNENIDNKRKQAAQSKAKDALDAVVVAPWDAYGEADEVGNNANKFVMEVTDQREHHGQLLVDVAPADGELDDVLGAMFEISQVPASGDVTQCVHLYFDGDNLAASFFKSGDRYVIRPETGVTIREAALSNGERVWVLE